MNTLLKGGKLLDYLGDRNFLKDSLTGGDWFTHTQTHINTHIDVSSGAYVSACVRTCVCVCFAV